MPVALHAVPHIPYACSTACIATYALYACWHRVFVLYCDSMLCHICHVVLQEQITPNILDKGYLAYALAFAVLCHTVTHAMQHRQLCGYCMCAVHVERCDVRCTCVMWFGVV